MSFRSTLACLVLVASAFSAAGQEGAREYRFATRLQPSLSLSNPALMDAFQGRLGTMEVQLQKANGGLVPLTESPDNWQAGAATESFWRVADKLTFFGRMDWQYFSGKDMGAQVLMDPAYNPVNFLESTTDTRGTKHRESYNLQGALSYRIGNRWALGAKVNYTSADQTKIKDPRFSNVWMDLDLHAGVRFQATERLVVGASLEFRNTLEQVKGGVYGTTDRQYFVQTDKGGFLGTVAELAGDYNPISTLNSRPMGNRFLGGALQAVLDERFASELWFLARSGYYGRKGSSTATFFEFGGWEAGYRGSLLLPAGDTRLHRVALDIQAQSLDNRENKFRYVTPSGQNTVVEYLGQDLVLERTLLNASLDYAYHTGTDGYEPSLSLGFVLDGSWRNQTTHLFPFTRRQQVATFQADVFGKKCFPAGRFLLSLELHALAGGGWGNPAEDTVDPLATSTIIKSFDTYLNRQFEYETAFRAGGQLGLTLRLPLKGWVPYLNLSERYVSLLSAPIYLEGRGRNMALVTVGCNF